VSQSSTKAWDISNLHNIVFPKFDTGKFTSIVNLYGVDIQCTGVSILLKPLTNNVAYNHIGIGQGYATSQEKNVFAFSRESLDHYGDTIAETQTSYEVGDVYCYVKKHGEYLAIIIVGDDSSFGLNDIIAVHMIPLDRILEISLDRYEYAKTISDDFIDHTSKERLHKNKEGSA
jgi:hypothetical protein